MTLGTIQKPEEPVLTHIEPGKAKGSYCCRKASSPLTLLVMEKLAQI